MINAVKRTQEVSLLSLGIQGIKEQNRCSEAFGKCLPGTTEATFLQYKFNAKLGIDGAEVTVTETGPDQFMVTVPEFKFIGYDEPTFEVAVEDGGVFSGITPDIDEVAMVNEILNDDAQETYLDTNEDILREQTQVFYDSLSTSVATDAETTFEFRS